MANHASASDRAGRRAVCGAALIVLGAAFLSSTPVRAQIVETASIANTFSYGFVGDYFEDIDAGNSFSMRKGSDELGYASEIGIDITGTADVGSLHFLHNAYCVGYCLITITTDAAFSLTNMGEDPVDLRFDSMITPGHLARLSPLGEAFGKFDFTVSQETDGVASTLFQQSGRADSLVETSGDADPFNGLRTLDNGTEWSLLDWSATPISVQLMTIAPGETSTIHYLSRVQLYSYGQCSDVEACDYGFQVAFGDPRNSGGVTDLNAGRWVYEEGSVPVIGAPFGAYDVAANFVSPTAPLPPVPDVLPPVIYGPKFESQLPPVPEPATWLSMLLGFISLGATVRRRVKRRVGGRSRPTAA